MKKKKAIWIAIIVLVAVLLALAGGCFFLAEHTDIPKLYFEGDITQMLEKSDVRSISFEYRAEGQVLSGFAELKVQGTSSLLYDKKNYTIKFYEDAEHSQKLKLDLGWGEQSKYCLKANWIDRTHARNIVTARLVTQIQQKYNVLTQAPCNGTIDGFPVEIYSNGKFLGLYTFNIPKDAWQFGMDEDNPDHIVICGENWFPANLFEAEPDFGSWAVEVGEESEETLQKMKDLFRFVMDSTDEEFREQFEEHLDLDAALNYYVMTDFAYLPDNRGKNMLLATYDGEKWYPSLYDLDTSWGTSDNGRALLDYEEELVEMSYSRLLERIETNFSEELAQRYFELRQDILTKEHIMAEFEAFRDEIPTLSFVKEAIRWGSDAIRRTEDLPGYNYEQIEAYLDTITDDLDAKYAAMLEG